MYVGAKRGLENKIVPDTGMPFHTLEIQGFKRKFPCITSRRSDCFLRVSVKQKNPQ